MKNSELDWRIVDNLTSRLYYKKRFAVLPVSVHTGEKIWMMSYYAIYCSWTSRLVLDDPEEDHSHHDFVENITKEEFVIRKLSGTL